jgi:dolichol-phosphate mannosyltransferase
MKNKITIIIPIFNEKENIIFLIKEIICKYKWINILVIDDWSTDFVEKDLSNVNYIYFKYLHNIKNKWLTYSIMKWIKNCDTEFFIVMDWDFQHPTANIWDFIKFFNKWRDIVIWNRKEINFKEKKYRVLISYLGNFLINLRLWMLQNNIKDPLTWFFWWKTNVFKENIIRNKKLFYNWWYKFLFDFLKWINIKNTRIYYFDFDFKNRKYWKSKLWFREYLSFILWLIK